MDNLSFYTLGSSPLSEEARDGSIIPIATLWGNHYRTNPSTSPPSTSPSSNGSGIVLALPTPEPPVPVETWQSMNITQLLQTLQFTITKSAFPNVTDLINLMDNGLSLYSSTSSSSSSTSTATFVPSSLSIVPPENRNMEQTLLSKLFNENSTNSTLYLQKYYHWLRKRTISVHRHHSTIPILAVSTLIRFLTEQIMNNTVPIDSNAPKDDDLRKNLLLKSFIVTILPLFQQYYELLIPHHHLLPLLVQQCTSTNFSFTNSSPTVEALRSLLTLLQPDWEAVYPVVEKLRTSLQPYLQSSPSSSSSQSAYTLFPNFVQTLSQQIILFTQVYNGRNLSKQLYSSIYTGNPSYTFNNDTIDKLYTNKRYILACNYENVHTRTMDNLLQQIESYLLLKSSNNSSLSVSQLSTQLTSTELNSLRFYLPEDGVQLYITVYIIKLLRSCVIHPLSSPIIPSSPSSSSSPLSIPSSSTVHGPSMNYIFQQLQLLLPRLVSSLPSEEHHLKDDKYNETEYNKQLDILRLLSSLLSSSRIDTSTKTVNRTVDIQQLPRIVSSSVTADDGSSLPYSSYTAFTQQNQYFLVAPFGILEIALYALEMDRLVLYELLENHILRLTRTKGQVGSIDLSQLSSRSIEDTINFAQQIVKDAINVGWISSALISDSFLAPNASSWSNFYAYLFPPPTVELLDQCVQLLLPLRKAVEQNHWRTVRERMRTVNLLHISGPILHEVMLLRDEANDRYIKEICLQAINSGGNIQGGPTLPDIQESSGTVRTEDIERVSTECEHYDVLSKDAAVLVHAVDTLVEIRNAYKVLDWDTMVKLAKHLLATNHASQKLGNPSIYSLCPVVVQECQCVLVGYTYQTTETMLLEVLRRSEGSLLCVASGSFITNTAQTTEWMVEIKEQLPFMDETLRAGAVALTSEPLIRTAPSSRIPLLTTTLHNLIILRKQTLALLGEIIQLPGKNYYQILSEMDRYVHQIRVCTTDGQEVNLGTTVGTVHANVVTNRWNIPERTTRLETAGYLCFDELVTPELLHVCCLVREAKVSYQLANAIINDAIVGNQVNGTEDIFDQTNINDTYMSVASLTLAISAANDTSVPAFENSLQVQLLQNVAEKLILIRNSVQQKDWANVTVPVEQLRSIVSLQYNSMNILFATVVPVFSTWITELEKELSLIMIETNDQTIIQTLQTVLSNGSPHGRAGHLPLNEIEIIALRHALDTVGSMNPPICYRARCYDYSAKLLLSLRTAARTGKMHDSRRILQTYYHDHAQTITGIHPLVIVPEAKEEILLYEKDMDSRVAIAELTAALLRGAPSGSRGCLNMGPMVVRTDELAHALDNVATFGTCADVAVLADAGERLLAVRSAALRNDWRTVSAICNAITFFTSWPPSVTPDSSALMNTVVSTKQPVLPASHEINERIPLSRAFSPAPICGIVRREVLLWKAEAEEQYVALTTKSAVLNGRLHGTVGHLIETNVSVDDFDGAVQAFRTFGAENKDLYWLCTSAEYLYAFRTAILRSRQERSNVPSSFGLSLRDNRILHILGPYLPEWYPRNFSSTATLSKKDETYERTVPPPLHPLVNSEIQLAIADICDEYVRTQLVAALTVYRSNGIHLDRETGTLGAIHPLSTTDLVQALSTAARSETAAPETVVLVQLVDLLIRLRQTLVSSFLPETITNGSVVFHTAHLAGIELAVQTLHSFWLSKEVQTNSYILSLESLILPELSGIIEWLGNQFSIGYIRHLLLSSSPTGQPGQLQFSNEGTFRGSLAILETGLTNLRMDNDVLPPPGRPINTSSLAKLVIRKYFSIPSSQQWYNALNIIFELRTAALLHQWEKVYTLCTSALMNPELPLYDIDRELTLLLHEAEYQLCLHRCHQALLSTGIKGTVGNITSTEANTTILTETIDFITTHTTHFITPLVRHLLSCITLLRRLRLSIQADDWSDAAGILEAITTMQLPVEVTVPWTISSSTEFGKDSFEAFIFPSVRNELMLITDEITLRGIYVFLIEAIQKGKPIGKPGSLIIMNYVNTQDLDKVIQMTEELPSSLKTNELIRQLFDTARILYHIRQALIKRDDDELEKLLHRITLSKPQPMVTHQRLDTLFSPRIRRTLSRFSASVTSPDASIISNRSPLRNLSIRTPKQQHDSKGITVSVMTPGKFAIRGSFSPLPSFLPSPRSDDYSLRRSLSSPSPALITNASSRRTESTVVFVHIHAFAITELTLVADDYHARSSEYKLLQAIKGFGGIFYKSRLDTTTANTDTVPTNLSYVIENLHHYNVHDIDLATVDITLLSEAVHFASQRRLLTVASRRLYCIARLLIHLRTCGQGNNWEMILQRLINIRSLVNKAVRLPADYDNPTTATDNNASYDSEDDENEYRDDNESVYSVPDNTNPLFLDKKFIADLQDTSLLPIEGIPEIKLWGILAYDMIVLSMLTNVLSHGQVQGTPGELNLTSTSIHSLRTVIDIIDSSGGCFHVYQTKLLAITRTVGDVREAILANNMEETTVLVEPFTSELLPILTKNDSFLTNLPDTITNESVFPSEAKDELLLVLQHTRELYIRRRLIIALGSPPLTEHNVPHYSSVTMLEDTIEETLRNGTYSDVSKRLLIAARGVLGLRKAQITVHETNVQIHNAMKETEEIRRTVRTLSGNVASPRTPSNQRTRSGLSTVSSPSSPLFFDTNFNGNAISSALTYFTSGPGSLFFTTDPPSLPDVCAEEITKAQDQYAVTLHIMDILSCLRIGFVQGTVDNLDTTGISTSSLVSAINSAEAMMEKHASVEASRSSSGQLYALIHIGKIVLNLRRAVLSNDWVEVKENLQSLRSMLPRLQGGILLRLTPLSSPLQSLGNVTGPFRTSTSPLQRKDRSDSIVGFSQESNDSFNDSFNSMDGINNRNSSFFPEILETVEQIVRNEIRLLASIVMDQETIKELEEALLDNRPFGHTGGVDTSKVDVIPLSTVVSKAKHYHSMYNSENGTRSRRTETLIKIGEIVVALRQAVCEENWNEIAALTTAVLVPSSTTVSDDESAKERIILLNEFEPSLAEYRIYYSEIQDRNIRKLLHLIIDTADFIAIEENNTEPVSLSNGLVSDLGRISLSAIDTSLMNDCLIEVASLGCKTSLTSNLVYVCRILYDLCTNLGKTTPNWSKALESFHNLVQCIPEENSTSPSSPSFLYYQLLPLSLRIKLSIVHAEILRQSSNNIMLQALTQDKVTYNYPNDSPFGTIQIHSLDVSKVRLDSLEHALAHAHTAASLALTFRNIPSWSMQELVDAGLSITRLTLRNDNEYRQLLSLTETLITVRQNCLQLSHICSPSSLSRIIDPTEQIILRSLRNSIDTILTNTDASMEKFRSNVNEELNAVEHFIHIYEFNTGALAEYLLTTKYCYKELTLGEISFDRIPIEPLLSLLPVDDTINHNTYGKMMIECGTALRNVYRCIMNQEYSKIVYNLSKEITQLPFYSQWFDPVRKEIDYLVQEGTEQYIRQLLSTSLVVGSGNPFESIRKDSTVVYPVRHHLTIENIYTDSLVQSIKEITHLGGPLTIVSKEYLVTAEYILLLRSALKEQNDEMIVQTIQKIPQIPWLDSTIVINDTNIQRTVSFLRDEITSVRSYVTDRSILIELCGIAQDYRLYGTIGETIITDTERIDVPTMQSVVTYVTNIHTAQPNVLTAGVLGLKSVIEQLVSLRILVLEWIRNGDRTNDAILDDIMDQLNLPLFTALRREEPIYRQNRTVTNETAIESQAIQSITEEITFLHQYFEMEICTVDLLYAITSGCVQLQNIHRSTPNAPEGTTESIENDNIYVTILDTCTTTIEDIDIVLPRALAITTHTTGKFIALRNTALALRGLRTALLEGRYMDALHTVEPLVRYFNQFQGTTAYDQPDQPQLAMEAVAEIQQIYQGLQLYTQRLTTITVLGAELKLRKNLPHILQLYRQSYELGADLDPVCVKDTHVNDYFREATELDIKVSRVTGRLQMAKELQFLNPLVTAAEEASTLGLTGTLVDECKKLVHLLQQLSVDGTRALQSFDTDLAKTVLQRAEKHSINLSNFQNPQESIIDAPWTGNFGDRLNQLTTMPRKKRLATALRYAVTRNDPDMVARITFELKTDTLLMSENTERRILYKSYSRLRNFYQFAEKVQSLNANYTVVPSQQYASAHTPSTGLEQLLIGMHPVHHNLTISSVRSLSSSSSSSLSVSSVPSTVELPFGTIAIPWLCYSPIPLPISLTIVNIERKTEDTDSDENEDETFTSQSPDPVLLEEGARAINTCILAISNGIPIESLTSNEPSVDNSAVAIHERTTVYANHILGAAIHTVPLRDEIYLQLLRGLTGNDNTVGLLRLLQLLYLCLSCFQASEELENKLEWYIRTYINTTVLTLAKLRTEKESSDTEADTVEKLTANEFTQAILNPHVVTRRLLHALHRTAYTQTIVTIPSPAECALIMDALYAGLS